MLQKRVACLYRLSTRKQVEKDEEFTLQRSACHAFVAEQPGWGIVLEYQEQAVSAFTASISSRPVLVQLLRDAMDTRFDVLLVFMLDRLCRSAQDGQLIHALLEINGVSLFSVREGHLNHVGVIESLASEAASESAKTALRVTESHKQMVQKGIYRGGSSPFGYRLKRVNRNGQEVFDIEIDPTASEVVKKIFSLAYHEGWGGNRIARYLNSQGVPSPAGKAWHNGAMNYILTNPVYKGYLAMGKTTAVGRMTCRTTPDQWILSRVHREDLVIVPPEQFDELQRHRQARRMCFQPIDRQSHGKNSPLLLVGRIRCGHCGYTLTTTYSSRFTSEKQGRQPRKRKPFYRCSGKGLAKVECAGQTTYYKQTIESVVLNKVYMYTNILFQLDISHYIRRIDGHLEENEGREASVLEGKLEGAYQHLQVLKSGRIAINSVEGEIQETEATIDNLNQELQDLRGRIACRKSSIQRLTRLHREAKTWQHTFEHADLAMKKAMLKDIIDSVTVWRGRLEVKFAYDLDEIAART